MGHPLLLNQIFVAVREDFLEEAVCKLALYGGEVIP
jgi:hypothetical protein